MPLQDSDLEEFENILGSQKYLFEYFAGKSSKIQEKFIKNIIKDIFIPISKNINLDASMGNSIASSIVLTILVNIVKNLLPEEVRCEMVEKLDRILRLKIPGDKIPDIDVSEHSSRH